MAGQLSDIAIQALDGLKKRFGIDLITIASRNSNAVVVWMDSNCRENAACWDLVGDNRRAITASDDDINELNHAISALPDDTPFETIDRIYELLAYKIIMDKCQDTDIFIDSWYDRIKIIEKGSNSEMICIKNDLVGIS